MESFSHPFYDIEVEPLTGSSLIKMLSVDGRRFTYELRAPLTPEAITYVRFLIDSAVFGDVVIAATPEGFETREARNHLKKHG